MKTLYDLSWQVSEEEYRKDSSYSYSTLAKFNREGFNNLDKLFDRVESPSLLFGSLVDTLLTDSEESFFNKYEVTDFSGISDTMIKIIKDLHKNYSDNYDILEDIPDEFISETGIKYNYYSSSKYDSYRVKKIKEDGAYYYKLLTLSQDKILINTEYYKDAIDCVEVLKNDDATKWYFEPNNPFDNSVERWYQLKFKANWENIPIKCMADLIIADHKNKQIIPCDLKTSGKKEWEFYKSFIEWNYWIQAQLYWYIINETIKKDPIYKDYTLTNYRFIVINRYNKKPLVWEYPDTKVITDCNYGNLKKYKCKAWRSLLSELHYYLTKNPKYPLNIYQINDLNRWLNYE